ncbi:3689_t:CDS:2 [Dentiscutata erythropus]|uniref:3689_t:CDS:1 n=1 Tax=Dentiscutata erythropus TaxID=1348616 RepID=A0A9N9GII9_9GLOM|nr:3689_t:CDS:2 [Dentiscutata erythropus]
MLTYLPTLLDTLRQNVQTHNTCFPITILNYSNQNIALFLQLLSNPSALQQALSAITPNSQSIAAPTSSEFTQTLPALSNAIIGVVNTSFPRGFAQNPITKEEWKQWKKAKKPEEDWKDFYICLTILIGYIRQRNLRDILAASCQKGKYAKEQTPGKIQKIINDAPTSSNSINIRSFELNSNGDNISEPSNTTPYTTRSLRSSKVPIQKLLPTRSKAIEVDDSFDYNDVSKLSNITSYTIKLSTPSSILSQLSTSSNVIEAGNSDVNDDNDISEFFTVSSLAKRSSRSSNPARLSTSSKAIGADNLTVNNNNDISEFPITTSRIMRSSRSSKISTRPSASSNRVEIDDNQSFGPPPLSPVDQNGNNIRKKRTSVNPEKSSKKWIKAKNTK